MFKKFDYDVGCHQNNRDMDRYLRDFDLSRDLNRTVWEFDQNIRALDQIIQDFDRNDSKFDRLVWNFHQYVQDFDTNGWYSDRNIQGF